MAVRPKYVPERYNFWPGEDWTDTGRFIIREASAADRPPLLSLFKQCGVRVSDRTLGRWLGRNDYTVRLVCRNSRHAVAACASQTQPTGTHILALHLHPSFQSHPLLFKALLQLAAGELPERPTTIDVPAADLDLHKRLADYGWIGQTRDEETYRFTTTLSPRP